MNFVNAELTKIAVNTFVTTKISYANMLADVCDRSRVQTSTSSLKPLARTAASAASTCVAPIGYGGPCFPRDNVAFAALARSLGATPDLAEATDAINQLPGRPRARCSRSRQAACARVPSSGLSYKPDTAVDRTRARAWYSSSASPQGIRGLGYDPKAMRPRGMQRCHPDSSMPRRPRPASRSRPRRGDDTMAGVYDDRQPRRSPKRANA